MNNRIYPIPHITDFPLLSQWMLLTQAVETIASDQGIKEGLYARAEWYLTKRDAQGKGYDGEQLEALCEVANFFALRKSRVIKRGDDYSDGSELEQLCLGEGGLTDRLLVAVPEYKVLNDFFADVFDGEDCPFHSLYRGNVFDPDPEGGYEPKFKEGDRVVIPAVVYELDAECLPEETGTILMAEVCKHHGVFHYGWDHMYLVSIDKQFLSGPDDDGIQEIDGRSIRFEDPNKEC